jgi:hypothetical protein
MTEETAETTSLQKKSYIYKDLGLGAVFRITFSPENVHIIKTSTDNDSPPICLRASEQELDFLHFCYARKAEKDPQIPPFSSQQEEELKQSLLQNNPELTLEQLLEIAEQAVLVQEIGFLGAKLQFQTFKQT